MCRGLDAVKHTAKFIMASIACLFMLNVVIGELLPVSKAFASPAIKVSNDVICDGQKKLAVFSIMGAEINSWKAIKNDAGGDILLREGIVDASVNRLLIDILGYDKLAAKAELVVKSYDNANCAGQEFAKAEQSWQTLDGEAMSLAYNYNIVSNVKGIVIELKYSNSKGFSKKAVYKLAAF